jgi:hypothetical protein
LIITEKTAHILFNILQSLPIETNIWKGHKNKGEVSKNEGGISKNKGEVSKNEGGISKNKGEVSKNEEGISKNEGGISKMCVSPRQK